MAIQTANLGTAPSGAGGDTFRSAATKFNENFTNNAHAASRLVGMNDLDLVEQRNICQAALKAKPLNINSAISLDDLSIGDIVFCDKDVGLPNGVPKFLYSCVFTRNLDPIGMLGKVQTAYSYTSPELGFRVKNMGPGWSPWAYFFTSVNTTVDPNGFIKAASPIVKLFSDKIDLNDEAQKQEIVLEKLGTGDYLITGSTGFAQEGWYVETPKDANGNVLFSVIYTSLENGDISVKTYKKKFDLETASIVADLTQPIDITENRWIDIRLQALPPIEYEMPTSKTPADFQPTGIAQAVSEMMNGAKQ
ncbi:hypothetical protein [Acinetobacter sp. CFCC 11171]|uniref:phage tail fiber protein n=1 Tax=Acinetobacter sp. CFCC 11171 TaxID=1775558 RepID=UPI000DD0311E|nr:hypothetical protein [Acinetobacter sp. CFCC 11171]